MCGKQARKIKKTFFKFIAVDADTNVLSLLVLIAVDATFEISILILEFQIFILKTGDSFYYCYYIQL